MTWTNDKGVLSPLEVNDKADDVAGLSLGDR